MAQAMDWRKREQKASKKRKPKGQSGIHIKKSHAGLLHENLGVPKDKPIPASKLRAAKNSPNPKIRKRATFAINAKSWNH